jgi:MFS family permease
MFYTYFLFKVCSTAIQDIKAFSKSAVHCMYRNGVENMVEKQSKRAMFSKFFLLFNTLVWYSMTIFMKDSFSQRLQPQAFATDVAYFGAVAGSSIVGALLAKKTRRDNLLFAWIGLGVASSFLPIAIYSMSWEGIPLAFSLLGIAVGLGLPSCLSFFIDQTSIEKRGHLGGVSLIVTSVAAVGVGQFLHLCTQGNDLIACSVILAGWRFVSLAVFYVLRHAGKPRRENLEEDIQQIVLPSVLRTRTFALYFTAWLVFSLIDSFEGVIIRNSVGLNSDLLNVAGSVNGVASAFSVFLAGILADRIGRKKVVISGFVALGIVYALVGFVGFNDAWYFHSIIDGMAGGIFMIAFVLLIWGDLSPPQSREKYYAIGNAPFFASRIIGTPATPYIGSISLSLSFSLAAFFLFVAVLPLMFAPETLPQEKMERKKLNEYLEKAKKIREEYEG